MFDEYFKETDPVKRKEILDSLQEKSASGMLTDSERDELARISTLFSLRYELSKKGEYVDRFIGCMMTLRDIAFNAGNTMSKKRTTQRVRESVHTLCLDRGEEFQPDILYRELYNLATLYIDICYEDQHYNSVFWGMGWMKTDSLIDKIRNDLSLIWEQIPTYLGDHEEYHIFERAISDVLDEQLKPDPGRRRR